MNALASAPLSRPPAANPAPAATSLKVVLVYDDFAAADRALRLVGELKSRLRPGFAFCPTPWSFDFLIELPWRSRALRDVDTADIVVLSISQPDEVPGAINHWVRTCLNRKRDKDVTFYVLLESEDVCMLSFEAVAPATPSVDPALEAQPRPARRSIDFSFFPFTTRLCRPTAFPT